tara:strand:+ start:2226 stop:2969 length:744 start_codon:yes stop_codon:yes gene_type:complete
MAAATAIIGTALAVGGSAMNFAQAAKQTKLQEDAERDAEKAMAAARAKLEENFYEGLDINLKSFEQERDALAGVGQQLLQAGQEAGRGAAATAGRVMLGMQQGEQDITNRQIDSLEKLERTVADEESRLSTMKATLDLQEAEGAQIAASDAAKNQASAISGGVQGLAAAGLGLMQSSELYGSKAKRESEKLKRQFNPTNLERLMGKQTQSVNAGDKTRGLVGITAQPGIDFDAITAPIFNANLLTGN